MKNKNANKNKNKKENNKNDNSKNNISNNDIYGSTRNIYSDRIDSLNDFRNRINQKYEQKLNFKNKISLNKNETQKINGNLNKKYYKKDISLKINNLSKKENDKSKPIKSSINLNKNLIKSKTKKDNLIFVNKKSNKNNINLLINTKDNNNENIKKNYNSFIHGKNKKNEEKENYLILSKISRSKKNYFPENLKTNFPLKISNQEKLFNLNNFKNYFTNNKNKDKTDNKIEKIYFINIPKKNQRKRNFKNQQLSEREGTNLFNKSYDLIKKSKNRKFKNTLKNKDNDNNNIENKFKRTFDDFQKIREKKINHLISNQNQINKTEKYKQFNLTLNKSELVSFPTETNFMATTNTSKRKNSYNQKLQKKKKLLGINLKFKEYNIMRKKLNEDLNTLSTKSFKRNIFHLPKNQKAEEEETSKTIRIINKENNSIKMMRKRSGYNNNMTMKINYENELVKNKDEKNCSLNVGKIRNIHKNMQFDKMPKGLDLMKKLAEN